MTYEITKPIPPTFEVYVELPGRTEMIPFYSDFTAKHYAAKYRACADVKAALVVDGLTGEIIDGIEESN